MAVLSSLVLDNAVRPLQTLPVLEVFNGSKLCSSDVLYGRRNGAHCAVGEMHQCPRREEGLLQSPQEVKLQKLKMDMLRV